VTGPGAQPAAGMRGDGAATATLVMLPGMDGTGTLFSSFAAAIGPRLKTTAVRYPVEEILSYAQLAEVARAAIPPQGPYVLLGESFSGPVAIALAAGDPGRLKGLVLCCTFASSPRPWLAAPVKALWRRLPLPPMPLLSAALMGGFSTPELRAGLEKAIALVEPAVLRSRLAQAMAVDARAQLRDVRVPVLQLRAEKDRLVTIACANEIRRLCPKAQTLSLPGPHFLLQTLPAECAAAVHGFVDRIHRAH
jgi:pimeloyl-ACP methyl ester carboxylesterase